MPQKASVKAPAFSLTKSAHVEAATSHPLAAHVLPARSPQRAVLSTTACELNVELSHCGIEKLAAGVTVQLAGDSVEALATSRSAGISGEARGNV